jgi:cytochrome c oxidase subunit 2
MDDLQSQVERNASGRESEARHVESILRAEVARFERWLAAQAEPAHAPDTPRLVQGQQVLLGSSCVYCHRIAGTNATGEIGPDLTHLASRKALAAATIPNSRGYLAGWILDPQHVKPGNKMPGTNLDGEQLQELLDYLESLK